MSLTDKLLARCTNEVKKPGRPRLDPLGEKRDQSLHQLTPTEKKKLKALLLDIRSLQIKELEKK